MSPSQAHDFSASRSFALNLQEALPGDAVSPCVRALAARGSGEGESFIPSISKGESPHFPVRFHGELLPYVKMVF